MPIEQLTAFLKYVPAGRVPSQLRRAVLDHLCACWETFSGSTDTKMEYWKVGRDGGPKDLSWDAPYLSFIIERHGSTVLGSSRGERQRWRLNLVSRTADHETIGFRQLRPRAQSLNLKALVDSVCEEVQKGRDSVSGLSPEGIIIWQSDYQITIRHGLLIPRDGPQQTLAGRRRRFRKGLESRMKAIGWRLVKATQSLQFISPVNRTAGDH